MKKEILIFIFLNSFLLFGQTPENDPHWQLVWQDLFNGPNINSNIWSVYNNYDHYGNEPQVFIDDNVFIENGYLVCKIKNEIYSCPPEAIDPQWNCVRQYETGLPYSYTSGSVVTKPAYDMQYGYLEARIKTPFGNGFWPAFWTISNVNGNDYEEIDIFEMLPGRLEYCDHVPFDNYTHNQLLMTTNIHSSTPTCEPNCNCSYNYNVHLINDYTQWHNYSIEWTPNKIIFYVDGISIRTNVNPSINNSADIIFGIGLNPFVSPYTNFPGNLMIDYVKLYELNQNCLSIVNTCNFNFNNINNSVKKSITIGGSNCSNIVPINSPLTLRATDFVEIKGDFYVPSGATFYIDVNSCY